MLISCTHKPYSINQIGSLSRCKLEETLKLHFSLQQWRSSKHMYNSLPIHQYMRFSHLQGWITQFPVFSLTLEHVLVCIWGAQGTLISINKFIHRKRKSRKKKRKSDSILEQQSNGKKKQQDWFSVYTDSCQADKNWILKSCIQNNKSCSKINHITWR